MFRFLQFIVAIILFVGILVVFGKKLHRSKAFVTGLSVVLIISSICSGVVLNAIPMPIELVQIEATEERNSKSQGNIIGIKSVIVDGKEYPVEFSEGTWQYSPDAAAYFWLNEDNKWLTGSVTHEITIKVPVGAGRKLVFLNGEQFGIVRVSYGDESKTYDLYKSESADKSVSIPDSNRVYDDFVKLCRLGGYGLMIVVALALAFLLVKSIDKESLIKLLYVILSVATTLAFCLNMKLTARSGRTLYALFYDFNRSFSGNFVLAVILVPMLYKAFIYCGGLYRKKFATVKGTLCIAFPAAIFSLFIVIGTAFINGENTLRPIFDNELQVLKSLFCVVGYFPIFFFWIAWIFNYLDCVDIYKVTDKKVPRLLQMYVGSLNKRPFITAFVTLLIIYIPFAVISYPGILMGDSDGQLAIVYGAAELSNAHPVTHTFFIGLCIKLGILLFGSCNAGVFTYSILQLLFMISVVAASVKVLSACNISRKILILLIIYYAFHPRIQYWMFLMTKDIMNAAFFLIFMVALYMIFTGKTNVYTYVILGIGDLGALLFRRDSYYIILISLILMLLSMKDFRKTIVIITACTLSFVLLWNNVILWTIISPSATSNGVDLNVLGCIMMQQTARYIRDAGDEVTQEEREIIDAVFDYENIVSAYDPAGRSDGVARTARASATSEDEQAYKKIWFEMFLKHPEIYIEATLNHKYEYLYPSVCAQYTSYKTSKSVMDNANKFILAQENLTEISYPTFDGLDLRGGYQGLRESFFKMPVFNLLYTSSSYFWILFIWLAYCILRRSKVAIAIMMPLLVMILVLVAGPCNGGYIRYTYPYLLCLPVVILLGLHSMKQKAVEQQNY